MSDNSTTNELDKDSDVNKDLADEDSDTESSSTIQFSDCNDIEKPPVSNGTPLIVSISLVVANFCNIYYTTRISFR